MKHRLFVAISIPADVGNQIDLLQRRLDQLRLPVRWEPSHQVHLTLAWLGRLADADVGQVKQMINQVAGSGEPGRLQPVDLGTLYHRHEPAVIYLLLADQDGQVGRLQAELAEVLGQVTPQPRRKFLPHVTIGRVKKSDPTTVKQSLDKLSQVVFTPWPEFAVDQIHLYESFLSKSGSSYARLASFSLGNRR